MFNRRTIIFLATFLPALLAAALHCRAQALDFTEKTWDFGSIHEEGGKVKHTFTFTNPGPGPVVVGKLSRYCTVAISLSR